MEKEILDKYIKAGNIVKKVKEYAKTLVKDGALAVDVADKVDAKIVELGGKPAFPADISINEIAAHYCPRFKDKLVIKSGDLVKVDLGVHIDGYLVDTAISISAGKNAGNEELIAAAHAALSIGIKTAKPGVQVREIGKAIQEEISRRGFQTIRNLSGHGVDQWVVHTSPTIPNFDNGDKRELKEGDIIAIEPFPSTGEGIVVEGKDSEVYEVVSEGNIRTGRDVLEYVFEEFETLPFCKRQLINKFGALKAPLAIKQMLSSGIIKEFKVLREKNQNSKVAQAEHTLIIQEKGNKILT